MGGGTHATVLYNLIPIRKLHEQKVLPEQVENTGNTPENVLGNQSTDLPGTIDKSTDTKDW